MRLIILLITMLPLTIFSQGTYQIAVLKYNGGGDWYANPTSLKNLIFFCNENIGTNIENEPAVVEANNLNIFNYPFIHITGHGNIIFDQNEIENIRYYLLSGGFIHIDDNYGMDKYIRKEIIKIFPDNDLLELKNNHPIFNSKYKFNGLPKIHEHDGKDAQAFGITVQDRLVLIYTYESDLGDGWEDQEVHKNSDEIRKKALKMGANIIKYAFEN
tara:strand:- start:114324 stop:114968 length:645 start_codon:yes stop_codon:yes gene_type:complete